MPERLLTRRLKLGTYLGIGLYVHWSFALVIAFVALTARDGGALVIAYSVLQLLAIFFCVTLHEYGHAMAARRFGIGTADITLLPIGGVARLARMPRIPWQELIVAIAGPLVNVVIVIVLLTGLFLLGDASLLQALKEFFAASTPGSQVELSGASEEFLLETITSPSLGGFVVVMMMVNTVLVVFNMIPAFPMDGGRVFRSVLAMMMDYRNATTIACRVGLLCAGLLAFYSLKYNPYNPFPVLIAAFVGYAGIAEARQVEVMESVRGVKAGHVMIRTRIALPMDMPLAEIAERWATLSAPALPVLSPVGTVVGMLQMRDVARAIREGTDPSTTAGQLIDFDAPRGVIGVDEDLESALPRVGRQQRQIPVVDYDGCLIGILDLDTMLARGELAREGRVVESRETFDATNEP